MSRRRPRSAPALSAVALSALAVLCASAPRPAHAQTAAVWNGNGGATLTSWSVAANWQNGLVPNNAATEYALTFNDVGGAASTSHNDLTGVRAQSLLFNTAHNFSLLGNLITLLAGGSIAGPSGASAATITIGNDLSLLGALSLETGAASTLRLTGAVSGAAAGDVDFSGPGTLEFSGGLRLTHASNLLRATGGTLKITAKSDNVVGWLWANGGVATVSGAGTSLSTGLLTAGANAAGTVNILDGASVVQTATGVQNAAVAWGGGVGTLNVSGAGSSLTVHTALTDFGGTGGVDGGAASLLVTGGATATFNGYLDVYANDAITVGGSGALAGGSLTIASLRSRGNGTPAGVNLADATATLTLGNSAGVDALYAGAISGAGTLNKTGTNTQTLSGALSVGTLMVNGGTLTLTGTSASGTGGIALNAGTLKLAGAGAGANALQVNGPITGASGGVLVLSGYTASGTSVTTANNVLTLARVAPVLTGGATVRLDGSLAGGSRLDLVTTMTGAGSFDPRGGSRADEYAQDFVGGLGVFGADATGAGTGPRAVYSSALLQITGATTFAPTLFANSGRIWVTDNGALTVAGGTTLRLGGVAPPPVGTNGGGTSSGGTGGGGDPANFACEPCEIYSPEDGGCVPASGACDPNDPTNATGPYNHQARQSESGALYVRGVNAVPNTGSGSNSQKVTTGSPSLTLALGARLENHSALLVAQATVTLGDGALITGPGLVGVENGTGRFVVADGDAARIESGFGQAGVHVYGARLAVSQQSGVLQTWGAGVGLGSSAFVKDGAGTLTLTGDNAYLFETTVAGGTLELTGKLHSWGTYSSQNFVPGTVNPGGPPVGITVTGSGSVLKLAGAQTGANALYYANPVHLTGGGTLAFGGKTAGAAAADVRNVFTGPVTLNGSGGVIDTGAHTVALVGAVSGSGGLTKTGAGTLTLTGANTHSGGTTISAGVLRVGDGGTSGTLGAGGVSIASGATLEFDRSDAYAFSGGISGAGSVTKSGAGTLTLSGAQTYTGATTVNGGTLRIDAPTVATSGVTVAAGATLIGNADFGAAALTVDDGAFLGGDGTYGAITLESGGTISPGNSVGQINGVSLLVDGGTVFEWDITAVTADRITLSGAFGIDPSSAGDITFAFEVPDTEGAPGGLFRPITLISFGSTDLTDADLTRFKAAPRSSTSGNLRGLTGNFALSPTGLTFLPTSVDVVPEPAAGVLALLGLGGAVLRRRSTG